MSDGQLAQLALMIADLRGAFEQQQQRTTELERVVKALQDEREALQAQVTELQGRVVPDIKLDLDSWTSPRDTVRQTAAKLAESNADALG